VIDTFPLASGQADESTSAAELAHRLERDPLFSVRHFAAKKLREQAAEIERLRAGGPGMSDAPTPASNLDAIRACPICRGNVTGTPGVIWRSIPPVDNPKRPTKREVPLG
jgi:hypothetical protein